MRLKWIVGAMDGQVACLISDGFNRNTTTTTIIIIKGITKWKGKKTFNLSPSVCLFVRLVLLLLSVYLQIFMLPTQSIKGQKSLVRLIV